jgi:hypothetical protein
MLYVHSKYGRAALFISLWRGCKFYTKLFSTHYSMGQRSALPVPDRSMLMSLLLVKCSNLWWGGAKGEVWVKARD